MADKALRRNGIDPCDPASEYEITASDGTFRIIRSGVKPFETRFDTISEMIEFLEAERAIRG